MIRYKTIEVWFEWKFVMRLGWVWCATGMATKTNASFRWMFSFYYHNISAETSILIAQQMSYTVTNVQL